MRMLMNTHITGRKRADITTRGLPAEARPRRAQEGRGDAETRRATVCGLMALIALAVFCTAGCEDEPPTSYIPVPYIEGYLFVDRPIEGIVVAMSQSLGASYEHGSAMIPNADVIITSEGVSRTLVYRAQENAGSYYLPDTTIHVKPETSYSISVRFPNGTLCTGETTTPARISWTREPSPVLQYPSDTVNLPSPDSLRIGWTPGSTVEYLIRVRCVDTAGYGAYLTPSTGEENGRTNNFSHFETPEVNTFYGTTRWGFVQTTGAPTVWTAFRWYGRNTVAILSADKHFIDWFKLTRFSGAPQFNSEFSNINGGAGVFGSAALVEKEVFLVKRKR
jgi:hypothetical protein